MENRTQLYNVSSHYAISYAIYFIGLFFLTNMVYRFNQLSLTMLVMTLMIPILLFSYVRNYRNKFSGGFISFSHAWIFSVMMHVFAGLLFAFFIFVYTRFLNQGYANWLIGVAIKSLEQYSQLDAEGASALAVNDSIKLLKDMPMPTPISMAMKSFWMIFNSGCFMGALIAIFAKRNEPNQPTQPMKHDTNINNTNV